MLSAKKKQLKDNSKDRKTELLKSIMGNEEKKIAVKDESEGTDYTSMFTGSPTVEKEPTRETLIDIFKLRPAPNDWNFYSPLPEHKMYEMIESIENIGLQERIIVWQEANQENYIILSGHNRFKAFEMIYNTTQNEEYRYIPAKVYLHDEIDETKAREVVVDTNWVQRTLRPIERAQSIAAKINFINERRATENIKGRTRDLVAERYGLKGRMVENYRKLINLTHHFVNMVNGGELSIVAGARLAMFSQEMQQWIFEEFFGLIDNATVNKLKNGMTKSEIKHVFNSKAKEQEQEKTRVRVDIPYGLEKNFNEFFEKWVEENNLTHKDFRIYFK